MMSDTVSHSLDIHSPFLGLGPKNITISVFYIIPELYLSLG